MKNSSKAWRLKSSDPSFGGSPDLSGLRYADGPVRRKICPSGSEFISATCKVIEYNSQSYKCSSYKEGARWYGKACEYKVSGSGSSGRKRSNLDIYCCMDHVSESCQRAATGEGLKIVWSPNLPTTLANGSTYCSQNYFQPKYDYFHLELLKCSFAMVDEIRVHVWNEKGHRVQTWSFIWLFRSSEEGLLAILLYDFLWPETTATQRSSWKATADIWNLTAIRSITICRESDAVPVGCISVDILLTLRERMN